MQEDIALSSIACAWLSSDILRLPFRETHDPSQSGTTYYNIRSGVPGVIVQVCRNELSDISPVYCNLTPNFPRK